MSELAARPLVVLSDVHLSEMSGFGTGRDLSRLIQSHPGYEVVLAGDVFDFSLDPPKSDPAVSVRRLLERHPELCAALRGHLGTGGRTTLIAGNHDAAAGEPRVREAILASLGLASRSPLSISPWFVRRGRVHIEHGHVYDPDNAPVHPLAPWSVDREPLGVALTRRFLAPTRAFSFAHEREATPLSALLRAFRLYGARAPIMVARYFAAASVLWLRAGRRGSSSADSRIELERFAAQSGIDAELLRLLLHGCPSPTHLSRSATFFRLYFDRVLATLALTGGAAAALTTGSVPAAALSALGGAYLAVSVVRAPSRYGGGQTERRLRDAAHRVALATGAELVILGHSHREDAGPHYLNSGSFGFPERRGRPFIVVGVDGRAERHTLERTG